jgi:hypothetical protein
LIDSGIISYLAISCVFDKNIISMYRYTWLSFELPYVNVKMDSGAASAARTILSFLPAAADA